VSDIVVSLIVFPGFFPWVVREGSIVGCVTRSRIDERGRIGLPRDMLESLGLGNGDGVVLCFLEDHIVLVPEDTARRMIQKAIGTGRQP